MILATEHEKKNVIISPLTQRNKCILTISKRKIFIKIQIPPPQEKGGGGGERIADG
jgi:hypothetical protein